MTKMIFRLSVLCVIVGILMSAAISAQAVGKYVLAYWRECAAYENQSPPAGAYGNHSCYIHIWNENGTPRAGVNLYTDWGVGMGTTDTNGYYEAVLYRPNGYDFQVRDGSNLSDTSPIFNQERAPNWGHYSYEVGFMYKADSNNAGTFDTSYDGVLNISSGQPCDLDAPRTKSIAYYSTNPLDLCSDAFSLGNWSDSFGQTFVANGNRVVAARCHSTVGGGGHLWYSATIHVGGPNGAQIGPAANSREVVSDEYAPVLVRWGINAVPVTPGQTYYVKFTRVGGGGMNIYRVNANNYASGQYYEDGEAIPGGDLQGMVVCGNVMENGVLTGNVKTSTGSNLSGATVSTNTGGYSATTNLIGNYSISNVTPGTYSLTASKAGYNPQTISGKTVSINSTTTTDFTLTDASAPSAPVVTDDGVYTTNLTQLHGIWSATDPESGIAGYSYAIGTSVGLSNVVDWTFVGTTVTKSVALTPGTTYYFSVKAKNGDGMWGPVSSSDGITAAEQLSSVADAKARADNFVINIKQSVVSRKDVNAFWIQDTNRAGGIKVSGSTSAVEGNKLDVTGVLTTDGGERAINNAEIANIGSGIAARPLGMGNAALSGNASGDYTPGAEDALGPNNVGLLVTCWGETASSGSDYFNISDGAKQVKVVCGSLSKPFDGMFAIVTGISGLEPDVSTFKPVLRVFKQTDIVIIPRAGAVGTISGRVTSGGAGLAGATVATGSGGYSALTDGSGYYTLSNVAEGIYDITASKSGYNSQVNAGVGVTKDAVVPCDFTLALQVGAISGYVKDGNGNGVSGAAVSTDTGGYTTTTASNGSYTLSNVAPGTYNLTASKSGYNSGTQTGNVVTVNATTTANLTITLQVGAISGNVKSGGVNLAGAMVSTNTGGYSATTDASGNYTLSSVVPGTYSVTASKSGYNSSTLTGKAVTVNATTTANFTLTANSIAVQDFETLPTWSSSFDASWGSAASWIISPSGQSLKSLQCGRISAGSSSKVLVFSVPSNTAVTLSVYMKCPNYTGGSYWMECAYKLGSNAASDFDANSGTWTMIQKFADTGTNGNSNTWTQYSAFFNTGSSTQVSVGFKHGANLCTGPTVGWDSLVIR